MFKVSIRLLAVLLSLVLTPWGNSQPPKERIYVWDFVDDKGQKTDLTKDLTLEFEEALSHTSCYEVLERKVFDRLLAHIKNEKAITDLSNISKESQEEVKKITNAQIVVFGEVDDDIDSGEIKISVTLQRFDSSKKIRSIRIQRGLRLHPKSREDAMKELVKKICESNTNPLPPSNDPSIDIGESKKKEIAERQQTVPNPTYTFDITGWVKSKEGDVEDIKEKHYSYYDKDQEAYYYRRKFTGTYWDFKLTVQEYQDGKPCGIGEMRPGHQNFPDTETIKKYAIASIADVFRGGCSIVPYENGEIHVFMRPGKECRKLH